MLRDAAMLEFDKRDEVLDVYHALEHLSDCGKILYGAGAKEFETWRDETMLELLWNGFELIEKRLDQLESEKQTIRVFTGYLTYHSTRLDYRDRLATGKSIGSGQVEGACKNLIVRRVNNMATLCAILYGDQWKLYWNTAK